jgi:hypothetical protein
MFLKTELITHRKEKRIAVYFKKDASLILQIKEF